MFFRQLPGRRRDGHPATFLFRLRGCRRSRHGSGLGRSRCRSGCRVCIACGDLCHLFAGFRNNGDGQPDADHGFERVQQSGDRSIRRRFDFIQHFFGFDLKQGLAGFNRVAL